MQWLGGLAAPLISETIANYFEIWTLNPNEKKDLEVSGRMCDDTSTGIKVVDGYWKVWDDWKC